MSCSTRRPLPGCFSTAGRTPRDGGSASTGRTIAPVRCRGRSRQPARPHGQTWSRSLRRQARRTSQCTPPPPRSRCFLLRGDRSTWRLAKRATRRLRQVRSASAPTLACTHCAHLRCGRTRVHLRAATETATTVSNMRMAPPQVDVACTPMHALVWDRPTKGGTSMWVCASHTTTLVCVACAVCGTSVPCPPGLALGASPRCRPDAGAVRLSLVAHPVRSHTHPLNPPTTGKGRPCARHASADQGGVVAGRGASDRATVSTAPVAAVRGTRAEPCVRPLHAADVHARSVAVRLSLGVAEPAPGLWLN